MKERLTKRERERDRERKKETEIEREESGGLGNQDHIMSKSLWLIISILFSLNFSWSPFSSSRLSVL